MLCRTLAAADRNFWGAGLTRRSFAIRIFGLIALSAAFASGPLTGIGPAEFQWVGKAYLGNIVESTPSGNRAGKSDAARLSNPTLHDDYVQILLRVMAENTRVITSKGPLNTASDRPFDP
jgi:hypothetical protein